MTTVETVRGPVECPRARPDADARAHLRARARGAPELRPRLGRELLGRGGARRRRDREAAAAARRRHPRRSSTRPRPGLGRYIPRIQRINAEVDLNIVVATGVYAFLELPSFLGLPRRRRDHRAVRARDPRGHRRHRRQGGVPQVRRRAARASSATCRASSPRSLRRASRRARRSWCTRTPLRRRGCSPSRR